MVTDLTVTGRVAQFGRGVMADVSAKLLGQFVDCLETKLWRSARCGHRPAPALPRRRAAAAGVASGRARAGRGPATARSTSRPRAPPPARRWRRRASTAAAAPTGARPMATARRDGLVRPRVRVIDAPEAEPVDLIDAAGAPVAKRAAAGRGGADGAVAAQRLPPPSSPQALSPAGGAVPDWAACAVALECSPLPGPPGSHVGVAELADALG